jgi:hypothetical protein
MRLSLGTLLVAAALLLTFPAPEALAQTNTGRTLVRVKVRFWDRKSNGPLRDSNKKVIIVRPTRLEIVFKQFGKDASPIIKAKDGEFDTGTLIAGPYRYFIEKPNPSDYAYDPAADIQDPKKPCPPKKTCPYISVKNGNNNHVEEIEITLLDKAYWRDVARQNTGPEIKLTFYRIEDAVYSPEERQPGGRVSQDEYQTAQVKELKGRVLDEQRRPLPDTLIEVYAPSAEFDDDLVLLNKTSTDSLGQYSIRFPQKSANKKYLVAISKSRYESQSIILIGAEVLEPDIILEETETAETAVSAPEMGEEEPLMLPPMEGTRRYTFSPRLMQSLPVPGYRSFDRFALLAPGVLPPPQTFETDGPGIGPGVGTAGQFTVNGLHSRENNFTIDGSDNNDEDIGTRRQGFLSLTPQPIETLQEFQIVTALADANYGRNIGGQVDALTQSGDTEFHGSLYGFYTDNGMNARDFFDGTTRGNLPTVALRRNVDNAPVFLDNRPLELPNPVGGKNLLRRTQAGLLFGGHISKVDTFYFGSLERKVNRENREVHFAVPTIRQRGVFESGETGFRAGGVPMYPASIPGNAIFSLYPFPNNPGGPYGQNTYTAVLPADGDATLFTVKLNRSFGDFDDRKNRPRWAYLIPVPMRGDLLTLRYNFSQDKNLIPVTGGAIFSPLRPRVRTQNPSLYLNRRLSNNVSDTIRFSFGRTRLLLDDTLSPPILASASFPEIPLLLNAPLLLNVTAPNVNGTLNPTEYVSASSPQGTALLNSLGYTSVTQTEQITGPLGQVIIPGFSPVGVDVYNFPQSRANNTFHLADTLRYIRDDQTFTFGGDGRRTQINSTLERNFSPLAQFNGLRNSGAALPLLGANNTPLAQQFLSGTTLAAAGAPTGLFQTLAIVPDSAIGIRYTQLNLFAQDEWSARQNLRLTLGVRYELNTIPDTVGRKVEGALDPERLRRQAEEAAQSCNGGRCADLAGALATAFPTDFKSLFGSDRNDFDFRFGFAFDPGDEGKAVVRGGFGVYSGQFPGIVLSQSRNAFPNFLPLNFATFSPRDNVTNQQFLFNPSNPILRQLDPGLAFIAPGTLNTLQAANPISVLVNQLLAAQRFNVSPTVLGLNPVLPQNRLSTPYSLQYGIIVERQVFVNYYVSASYVGTRGVKLLRVMTPELGANNSLVNVANVQALGQSRFPYFTGSELPAQSRVISEAFAISRTLFESSASSKYNSIQLELRRRYVNRFQLGSALTYSHSLDDASDFFDTAGAFALPQNNLRRSERASANFDARWRWATHFLYDAPWDIPFMRRFSGNGLGGWQIAGIITAQTGQPFTVNSAFDVNRDGNLTDRLDNIDGLIMEPAEGDARIRLRFAPGVNPQALLAADGKDGSIGRNTFRAPGIFTFDLSVVKNLNFSDRHKLYVGAEFFNLFNRTHFAIPERILESPAFGQSVRTVIPARRIQLKFKYSF